jgi:3D-(3,5/4)-trihydroxycyclohexane-1,2-dione acylhydrolase (decyclizing)
MAQEIVTAVQEDIKLTIVLVQNHGFASIGALSESVGSQRFGTRYRTKEGELLPVDLAAVAAGLGADVHRATSVEELEAALRAAAASPRITVVEVQTDPLVGAPSSEAWWDVPVAEVAELDSTRGAREAYEQNKRAQQPYVNPREKVTP